MKIIMSIFFKESTIHGSSYVGLTVAAVLHVFLNLYKSVPECTLLANNTLSVSYLQVRDVGFCRTSLEHLYIQIRVYGHKVPNIVNFMTLNLYKITSTVIILNS